jgi:hypothetical protein
VSLGSGVGEEVVGSGVDVVLEVVAPSPAGALLDWSLQAASRHDAATAATIDLRANKTAPPDRLE